MKAIGFVAGVLIIGLITLSSGVLGPAAPAPLGAEAHPVPTGRPLADQPPGHPARKGQGDPADRKLIGSPAGSESIPVAGQKGLPRDAGEPDSLPDALLADPAASPRVDQPGAETPTPDTAPRDTDDENDAPVDQAEPALPSRLRTDVIEREEGVANVAEDGAGWLGFFTPFRSEASARGFAQHLEASTGRQFRVTRARPGDYRVEFRIVSEEDRDARIAEIEAASGLALRSGQL
jgi:hypothetical protein